MVHKYVQIDVESFQNLCDENRALKEEKFLLECQIEKLQTINKRLGITNRGLLSQVNANKHRRTKKLLENLDKDISSFEFIVKENAELKEQNTELIKENTELKEEISQVKSNQ